MISTIAGKVTATGSDSVILDVQGIGFEIAIPKTLATELKIGEPVMLYTHLHVREDILALYGFATPEDKRFFNLFLSVEGIGPRLALAILSTLSLDVIRGAIVSEKPEIFSRVPGIGKKTAQKILIQLQGKISNEGEGYLIQRISSVDEEVLEALVGLGYSVVEAQSAVQSLPADTPDTVEDKLRLALQYFNQ
ncbi:MAG: Holliday junction branch migration protein RuvA [Anaerolineaceae bacterium]|jgi:Holliday junction DNA helicase RuvA|nr:Holliday junction branch migration protein RuvA [Anaerolineaceae bacterium]HNX46814.1 Holliday junction branch migration protein RuvA [Anaerolineaceae bacterium]HPT24653.1 Holliday junction branch migration protein RuvA [Anaerolineaceae bacterium]